MPDVEETGDTLVDNARLKARALVEATGLPAVADDTGLEVEALGGAPGVYSARFAGEHATYADNVAKLLTELARPGPRRPARRARFRCVAMVGFPDGGEVVGRRGGGRGHRPGAAGDGGIRLRPGVRPRRPRRAHLRRDEPGGEARGLPPGPGLPGAGRPAPGRREVLRTGGAHRVALGCRRVDGGAGE